MEEEDLHPGRGARNIPVSSWSENSRLRWATTLILHILTYALVIITAPLSLFFVLRKIPEYERAVVFGSTLDMAFVRGRGSSSCSPSSRRSGR